MDFEGIRVNWRAALLAENGQRTIHGRLIRLFKSRMVVEADQNLPSGYPCRVVLMYPKNRKDEADQFIEGSCVVANSVMSAMRIHITLERVQVQGEGEILLNKHIDKHNAMWKRAE